MLMPTLWFGFSKPNMTTLPTPFITELQQLPEAFSCKQDGEVKAQVFTAVHSLDAAARSAGRNFRKLQCFLRVQLVLPPWGTTL